MDFRCDRTMYERVFQILKNRIACGLLPAGASLSSRANLCGEFGTPEKTIRRGLALLKESAGGWAAMRPKGL